MNSRSALGWLTGLIIALAIISAGCSGTTDDPDPTPDPATATLTGTVVAADNTDTAIANAEVIIEGTGRTATTGPGGQFTIENVPPGDRWVEAQTPLSAAYGTARARVPLNAGQTTTVNLAVLPIGTPAIQSLRIEPENATVDLNGRVTYRAQILGPSGARLPQISPTWVVRGGLGEITREGLFSAEMMGSGQVVAHVGGAQATANLSVVEPRPPLISSFQVNPRSLPATGGDIFVSASISDGDGVRQRDVHLEILPVGGEPIIVPMEVADPESAIPCPGLANCYLEASFSATWPVPANSNRPDGAGVQAPVNYSISLRATDRSGRTSQSEFIEFVVRGIDSPPPTPGI